MIVPDNVRSQAVALGSAWPATRAADFDHPLVPEGSPGRRHRLFRITADTWRAGQQA